MARPKKSTFTNSVEKNIKEKITVKDKLYSVTLQVEDTEQTKKGDSILEIVNSFEFPTSFATPALFTLKKGATKLHTVIVANKVRQFFALPTQRELLCEGWERQLNES